MVLLSVPPRFIGTWSWWKQHGNIQLLVVGPWTSAGAISDTEGAEILWIKLKLGTFMPHMPTSDFLDVETILPTAAGSIFLVEWIGFVAIS